MPVKRLKKKKSFYKNPKRKFGVRIRPTGQNNFFLDMEIYVKRHGRETLQVRRMTVDFSGVINVLAVI